MRLALIESEYDDLEDADEFHQGEEVCMYCGGEFDAWAARVLYDCLYCPNKVCNHCMERMQHENAPEQWEYDYADDTGHSAVCPNCQ